MKQGWRHGFGRHPLYHTWWRMMRRCHNPKDRTYADYGGRGIYVFPEWHDLTICIPYLEKLPRNEGDSIDRIRNNKGYEPGNVRFAPMSVQCRNKRSNKWITHNGITLCLEDWAKRIGLSQGALCCRFKAGWTTRRALETPRDASKVSKFRH